MEMHVVVPRCRGLPDASPVLDAVGVRVQPCRAGRQIVSRVNRAGADARLVEDDDVGVPALGQATALGDAVEPRGNVGELMDRFLESEETALPNPGRQQRRRPRSLARARATPSGASRR